MRGRALRLLTHNVKMLPGLVGKGEQDLERAARLAAAILAAEPRYDVICLQEVFDEHARALFARAFAGFELVAKGGDDLLHQDSGLFLAAATGITGSDFREYDAAAGVEKLTDKGILWAWLDTVAVLGVPLCVLNTHLQSSGHDPTEHADVRAQQLAQARRVVRSALARSPAGSVAALLLGDLNVVGESAEHRQMLALLGSPRDLYRESNPALFGYTYDGQLNHNLIADDERHVRQRLDYVLAFDALPADAELPPLLLRPLWACASRVVAFGDVDSRLSDHFGVEVVVELAPAPSAS